MTMNKLHDRPLFSTTLASPLGAFEIVASDAGVAAILWPGHDAGRARMAHAVPRPDHPVLRQATQELQEYFAGRRKRFDLPLDPVGTPFQRAVWNALLTIPYGETRSYSQIAQQIGALSAVRAVGAANGKNPIPIVVPCHRVIGATGELTGFAAGLEAKAFLLSLEAQQQELPGMSLTAETRAALS